MPKIHQFGDQRARTMTQALWGPKKHLKMAVIYGTILVSVADNDTDTEYYVILFTCHRRDQDTE
jgi:hypothetical protein